MVLFHLIFLFYTTIRPKLRVLIDLFLLCAYDHSTEIYGPLSFILSSVHTTLRPRLRVLTDLFILFAHNHSTKKNGPLLFILSLVYDHSTKNEGPHQFIFFICTSQFNLNLGSSLIYSFFSERLFYQSLGSPLIYFFHLQTTIRQKIRVPINLIFLFVHDHSTKEFRGHFYSLIYSFLNCASISLALFLAVLPLHFVDYIQSSASYPYIFRTLYSWNCCSDIFCALHPWPYEVWSNYLCKSNVM